MRLDGHDVNAVDHDHWRRVGYGQRERDVHRGCKSRQRPDGHHQHRHAYAHRDSGGLVHNDDRAAVAISGSRWRRSDVDHRHRRRRLQLDRDALAELAHHHFRRQRHRQRHRRPERGGEHGPARTATVTIAGQTHTVSQTSGCMYSIAPTSHSLDEDAQTPPTIAVTTAAGCTWTAVSNNSFITVENGDSGTGPGTVRYKVTKNKGNSPRTGTLTIAGRTFTVIQSNNEPE